MVQQEPAYEAVEANASGSRPKELFLVRRGWHRRCWSRPAWRRSAAEQRLGLETRVARLLLLLLLLLPA